MQWMFAPPKHNQKTLVLSVAAAHRPASLSAFYVSLQLQASPSLLATSGKPVLALWAAKPGCVTAMQHHSPTLSRHAHPVRSTHPCWCHQPSWRAALLAVQPVQDHHPASWTRLTVRHQSCWHLDRVVEASGEGGGAARQEGAGSSSVKERQRVCLTKTSGGNMPCPCCFTTAWACLCRDGCKYQLSNDTATLSLARARERIKAHLRLQALATAAAGQSGYAPVQLCMHSPPAGGESAAAAGINSNVFMLYTAAAQCVVNWMFNVDVVATVPAQALLSSTCCWSLFVTRYRQYAL